MSVAEISLGCMRIHALEPAALDKLLDSALEVGITFFDHADIYGGGNSETVFAASAKRLKWRRESIVLQSKCGIRKGEFDFSRQHILAAVEGSLKRLDTDFLDVLLLHRPDALVEPGLQDQIVRAVQPVVDFADAALLTAGRAAMIPL